MQRMKDTTKIPNLFADLIQIISEKQSKKLFSRPMVLDSERQDILDFWNEFSEVNRLPEYVIMIEELLSQFGQVNITLDFYGEGTVPRLAHADPYMLSRIGKFHVEEKTASVYEEWTDKKVKRTWYNPNQDVQVDSLRAPIEELKGRELEIEEKNHNLGCLPIVEQMNKQIEVQVATARIGANLSNLITETANMYGVNRIEAEKILK